MLYLTCTMISSVDLERYRVFRAKDIGIRGMNECTVFVSFSIMILSRHSNPDASSHFLSYHCYG